jgi:hypothetical protein
MTKTPNTPAASGNGNPPIAIGTDQNSVGTEPPAPPQAAQPAQPAQPAGLPPVAPEEAARQLRYHAAWRQVVFARARRLNLAAADELAAAPAALDSVTSLVETAVEAAKYKSGLRDWYEGTLHERAWTSLHQAEVRLVQALPPGRAELWYREATGIEQKTQMPGKADGQAVKTAPDSYMIASMLRAYYDKSDEQYEEARLFRNRLVSLSLIGAAGTGLLLATGASGWWHVGPAGGGSVVQRVQEFLLVALFGAVGAFITGLPALSRAPAHRSPFRLPLYQVSVKLAVGPVFALLGLLALQSGFVNQLQPFTSFNGNVLLWATIFGGAQQALTQVLDRKAGLLADAPQSTEPQPVPT